MAGTVKNNEKGFVMILRFLLACVCVLIQSGCAQLVPGSGIGYVEKYDEEYGALMKEMMVQFYDVLRPPEFTLDEDRRTHQNKYANNKGFIRFAAPLVNRRDICNRRQDPNCGGFAFSEELLAHPEIRTAMENWLMNFCARSTAQPSEITSEYYNLIQRQIAFKKLRPFMGCDGAPKGPRNIHFYIVRNFDEVFNGDWDHTSTILKQSVIDEYILKLNQ